MPIILEKSQVKEIADLLKSGKVGILPTDTVYGIHCLAGDASGGRKISQLKRRPEDTKFITLISDPEELTGFNINLESFEKEQIAKFWPGPNTLIFEDSSGSTKSFRLPADEFLISLLRQTGPLISTSANLHGQPISATVQEAVDVFAGNVDFYVDGNSLNNPPSNIYRVVKGSVEKIR